MLFPTEGILALGKFGANLVNAHGFVKLEPSKYFAITNFRDIQK